MSVAFGQERRAPGFALLDQTGKWQDMQDYRGKVVLLDFMQTACQHCQQLTGTLGKLKAKYGSRLNVLTVIVAQGESPVTVKKFIDTFKVTNPVLIDCGQVTGSYARVTPQNPQIHFPHVTIVDGNGMVRHDVAFAPGNDAKFTEGALAAALDPLMGPAASSKK